MGSEWINFETQSYAALRNSGLSAEQTDAALEALRPHVEKLVLLARAVERQRTTHALENGYDLPAVLHLDAEVKSEHAVFGANALARGELDDGEHISDGMGSVWSKCGRGAACGLHVVRPGSAGCYDPDCEKSR